jgi:hypothetical protein
VSEILSQMSGGQLIGFFAVVGGMIIAVSATLGSLWMIVRLAEFRARRFELEVGLKRDMITRGMSVDEIERVIAAGRTKPQPCSADSALEPASSVSKSCL